MSTTEQQSSNVPADEILQRLTNLVSTLDYLQQQIKLTGGAIGELTLKMETIDQRLQCLETALPPLDAREAMIHFLDEPPTEGSELQFKILMDSTLADKVVAFVQTPDSQALQRVDLIEATREAYIEKMQAAGCEENRWYWVMIR